MWSAPLRFAAYALTWLGGLSRMQDRKEKTRTAWLEVMSRHRGSLEAPETPQYWSQRYDRAGRDEIIAIQKEKLAVLTPFGY